MQKVLIFRGARNSGRPSKMRGASPPTFCEDSPSPRGRQDLKHALREGILNLLRAGNRSLWGSGRPRGPRRPFQKVGGFAPHILGGFPGPPGPARLQKRTPNKPSQTAFRYPDKCAAQRCNRVLIGFNKVLLGFSWVLLCFNSVLIGF